ncbi:hypothetical protein [Nonomuraea dietziae]|uniref:hypothetical protein n=1 Tax=Nonomuraea dietziae TaxID=65515 RepID=UPI0033D91E2A
MTPLLIGLALATAVPGQSIPKPDPIKVLTAQTAPGKGVTVSSVTKVSVNGRHAVTMRTDGLTAFRKGGQDVDDVIRYSTPIATETVQADYLFPTLFTRVKGVTYTSGGVVVGWLPLDKKWARNLDKSVHPGSIMVNLFRPGTLRALLNSASSVDSRGARGTIAAGKLPGSPLPVKLSWELWFDAKGRVTRFTTATPRTGEPFRISSDLRFSGWRANAVVTPPSKELVIDADDLPELALPEDEVMKLVEAGD